MGKGPGKSRDLLYIDRGRNVDSAMTDINADLHKANQIGIMEYWNSGILGLKKEPREIPLFLLFTIIPFFHLSIIPGFASFL
jgi:hypothetical protein